MPKLKRPTKASIKRAADRAEGKRVKDLEELPADVAEFEPLHGAKPKTGRPSSFKPEYVDQARRLCEVGLTDQEIADFFEVDVYTIHRWKHGFPEFCHALKNAKDVADERVERSLYHRAIGYSFEAEEVFQYQGEIVRAKVRKHLPPDTTAAIFWLKNRRKEAWRDVQRHEFGRAGEFEKLSDTELVTELARTAQLLLEDKSEEK